MASHAEQAIAARIAAVRVRRAQQQSDRAEFAERRRLGLTARHAVKLRNLAARSRVEPSPDAADERPRHSPERTTTMAEPLPSRAECIAAARAVLDRALHRLASDRAAGRLAPEVEAILQRLEREQHEQEAAREEAMYRAARVWRAGCDAMDRMSVADAARACYTPGGPSLAELEQRIAADRAARTTVDRHQDASGAADE
ncbi:hypothetical protein [Streptomyces sp. NPDC001530]|uniref:hypothetical protein n=1 Tax=Streptomyces sp. NPDC001530 TaxID=3364582 RepID=UPI0036924C27